MGFVHRRAVDGGDLVGSFAGGHRKVAHPSRIHRSQRARSLLHALHARLARVDCSLSDFWRHRGPVHARGPRGEGLARGRRVISHWILDLIVHTPDLPLYDNTAKIGFGLWRHVALSFPLEFIVLGLGAWLYARVTTFKRSKVFWGFVIFLAAMQVYANFGPPPSSTNAMAVMALSFYVALALLAAGVERFAVVSADR